MSRVNVFASTAAVVPDQGFMNSTGSKENFEEIHRDSNYFFIIILELGDRGFGITFILLYTILKTECLI